MITWFQVWPILAAPFAIISLLAAIPTFTIQARLLGGGPIREWILNSFFLPILPARFEDQMFSWFSHARAIDEWLLVALIALNINAILLPLLYWIARSFINFSGWYTSKSLAMKTGSVRR